MLLNIHKLAKVCVWVSHSAGNKAFKNSKRYWGQHPNYVKVMITDLSEPHIPYLWIISLESKPFGENTENFKSQNLNVCVAQAAESIWTEWLPACPAGAPTAPSALVLF